MFIVPFIDLALHLHCPPLHLFSPPLLFSFPLSQISCSCFYQSFLSSLFFFASLLFALISKSFSTHSPAGRVVFLQTISSGAKLVPSIFHISLTITKINPKFIFTPLPPDETKKTEHMVFFVVFFSSLSTGE